MVNSSNISVSIEEISKAYNGHHALEDISLSIAKGELFGFIGPDGAGKTTLIRILTTLLIPDTGKAIVEGYDTLQEYPADLRLYARPVLPLPGPQR
jgi:ABC-2 type transport system ATP-binding protein